MAKRELPKCEYCGGPNVDEAGVCGDCGNEKRAPLVSKAGTAHKNWYTLDEELSAEEAKPHPKPTEIPENMRVPEHPEWYEISGADRNRPRRKPTPENRVTKNAVLTLSIGAVLALMCIAGYLLFALQKDIPVGFGRH